MGMFSDLNQKSSGGNRNYFYPGIYTAEILSVKYKPKGYKGMSYIVEFEIIEVLLHREAETRTTESGKKVLFEASRRVGDKVSSVFKLDGANAEMALGNLADFMRAVIATTKAHDGEIVRIKDVYIEDPDAAVLESASDEQPLVGLRLEVEVNGTITVTKQEAFSNVTYKVPRDLIQAIESAAA